MARSGWSSGSSQRCIRTTSPFARSSMCSVYPSPGHRYSQHHLRVFHRARSEGSHKRSRACLR
jgi:hypothetical protein